MSHPSSTEYTVEMSSAKSVRGRRRRGAHKQAEGEEKSNLDIAVSDESRGRGKVGGIIESDDTVEGLVASFKQLELDKKQVEEDRKKLEQEMRQLKAALEKKDEVIAKKDKVIADKNKTINEQSETISRRDYTVDRFIFRSPHQKKVIAEQKKVLDKYGLAEEASPGLCSSTIPRGAFPSRYRPEAEDQEMLE